MLLPYVKFESFISFVNGECWRKNRAAVSRKYVESREYCAGTQFPALISCLRFFNFLEKTPDNQYRITNFFLEFGKKWTERDEKHQKSLYFDLISEKIPFFQTLVAENNVQKNRAEISEVIKAAGASPSYATYLFLRESWRFCDVDVSSLDKREPRSRKAGESSGETSLDDIDDIGDSVEPVVTNTLSSHHLSQLDPLILAMLSKLPNTKYWPKTEKDKWINALRANLDMLYPDSSN